MNSDRCYHVPTSEGQTMCTCWDYIMWLRFVIRVQAEYLNELEQRLHPVEPRLIDPREAVDTPPADC